jgi:hypothetical protein
VHRGVKYNNKCVCFIDALVGLDKNNNFVRCVNKIKMSKYCMSFEEKLR